MKGPDAIINHTSVNPSTALRENEYTTSIRKEEQILENLNESGSESIKDQDQTNSERQVSNQSGEAFNLHASNDFRGLIQNSSTNKKQSPFMIASKKLNQIRLQEQTSQSILAISRLQSLPTPIQALGSSFKSTSSQQVQAILSLKRFDVNDKKQAFRNKYGTEEKKRENVFNRQFTS